jgi:F0F1-type ATP synthase assembly protein I
LHQIYFYPIILERHKAFVFVVNNENKKKIDWKPALLIFGRVSTWVIVPIVLSLVIGKALDTHYGSEPWIFLALTGIAFLFSIFGIVKTVKDYIKKL